VKVCFNELFLKNVTLLSTYFLGHLGTISIKYLQNAYIFANPFQARAAKHAVNDGALDRNRWRRAPLQIVDRAGTVVKVVQIGAADQFRLKKLNSIRLSFLRLFTLPFQAGFRRSPGHIGYEK